MATCVRLENLRKTFGPVVAVDDVTLEIERGEVFGLLGPNGAGKSTTLYMLSSMLRPTSGQISIFGKNLTENFVEIMSRTGVLTEKTAFYPHLSVTKNLLISARLSGREVTIDRALELVGLRHMADEHVQDLSYGMKQRLGLANAFLHEPELLILDEPTNGLDVEHTQDILQLLRHLADTAQVTIIVSSHMMHEVEFLCDRIGILNQGNLIACETTDRLISFDQSVIDVLLDAPESAGNRLAEESWVESVKIKSDRITVRLKDPNPHHLITFLISNGYQLSAVIPRQRTLQEYFLKVLNQ
ncbi:MAG: bacitracin ABC transporter ATP-binding protein [Candidatus Hydrogenedentota bacterium]|nr:MAG: bacitracin ABC transporter ATP-binding protein [Candidatus Hydrogenedentota bacterium]